MDYLKIAQTLLLIGADLPAYKALFEETLQAFGEDDQASLRAAYDEALVQAAQAHAAAQAV